MLLWRSRRTVLRQTHSHFAQRESKEMDKYDDTVLTTRFFKA